MRFGTDGIRGRVNVDLTAELTLQVGRAVGRACREGVLGGASGGRVVVGRDTRPSGELLEAAIVAGLCSEGIDVLLAGIIPTPGVAFLVGDLEADAGVVLSASHNPPEDNGIKLFGPGGWKLTGAVERQIEALIGSTSASTEVGRVRDVLDAEERYLDHLAGCVAGDLGGLKVVVDCAWGAAYRVAPRALARAGAEVIPIHAAAEGHKINAGCGATHPELVASIARREGAIGLAHDGDADRVLASDEMGNIVDGDAIIAILARALRDDAEPAAGKIAVTVMANQALRSWCAREGIALIETAVGDRYVLEAMRERELVLGGEQSGHVIRLDHATTGDGVLTALLLLQAVAAHGGRLADVVPFRPLPQILINVKVVRRELTDGVHEAVERARHELGDDGRVLVRASGTEPLVRVMVEAPAEQSARELAGRIAGVVERELGA